MTNNIIRVLVVEDSPVERDMLLHVLGADPQLYVAGVAADGVSAVELACRLKPDVITMDIHLPELDGLGATRAIMERCPTPIVIVSASSAYSVNGDQAFRAMEAGALALAGKPLGLAHSQHAETARELIQTVKLMAEVKVVRRRPHLARPEASLPLAANRASGVRIVAVAASAGGPQALRQLLTDLPADFPAPILIVQHITPGFAESFAQWLNEISALPVRMAAHGEKPQPGQVYIAPSEAHLGVTASGTLLLSTEMPENGIRPAAAYLFRSVGNVFGKNAIGVILTGMGRDGAEELKGMRDKGAITLAQDEESALVYGMPGAAVELGGVTHVLPLEKIAPMLVHLTQRGDSDRDADDAAASARRNSMAG